MGQLIVRDEFSGHEINTELTHVQTMLAKDINIFTFSLL
jgi:hypothetical protein